jgi:DNA-binding NarL/FixJ family response regulator
LGKANKIIAHELGMCEGTVKVHVRNIMRKVGATNRTQAAFKGQRFLNDLGSARMSTGVQNRL